MPHSLARRGSGSGALAGRSSARDQVQSSANSHSAQRFIAQSGDIVILPSREAIADALAKWLAELPLLTSLEVGKILRCGRARVGQLARAGKLRSVRRGRRRLLFRVEDVRDYIASAGGAE